MLDTETFLEGHPDTRAEAVTNRFAHEMVAINWFGRYFVQIAAEFTHIANGGGAILTAVFPEFTSRELTTHGNTGSAGKGGAPAHAHGSGMIEGQSDVNNVSFAHLHGVTERTVGLHPATVRKNGGFGHASCAGRIDIEQSVVAVVLISGSRIVGGLWADLGGQITVAGWRGARVLLGVLISEPKQLIAINVEVAQHFTEVANQFFSNDGHLWLHEIDAVGQYLAGLGGVHQRRDHADFG